MDKSASGPTQCLRCEDYTIGWIAALPVELGAARKMLDSEHYPLAQDANDSVVYSYGSIGPHNIVMACLQAGQVGNNSAATIATAMRLKFPYLRFGFLVGIAGGVPTAQDIRLGDIVVSQPNSGHGGVIQHDFGKNTVAGFQRTSFLNGPPDVLLSALSTYQACNLDLKGNLTSHSFKPKKASSMLLEYPGPDLLFRADYEHVNKDGDCTDCDTRKLYKSKDRSHRASMVHYGTIASGNQVVKNGVIRDQISEELGGILCYEMEAAGVMSTLRCLVVRGICDYSDSHKNKDWQPYAALAAAIYVKELLSFVPVVKPQQALQYSEAVVNSMADRLSRGSKKQPITEQWQSFRGELTEYGFKTQSISGYDALRVHSSLIRLRCPGTTQWILNHEHYQTWRQKDSATLWLTGKIGSGKTLVTSTIIEQLLNTVEDKELVLHFFHRYSHKDELSVSSILDSCIKQTLDYLESRNQSPPPNIQTRLKSQYSMHRPAYDFVEVIHEIFEPLLSLVKKKKTLVIDGLDECENNEIPKILKFARTFIEKPGRSLLISGRESLDIVHSIPGALRIQVSENTVDDISVYIRWKIEEKMLDRRIIEDPNVRAEIEAILSSKAEQMLLWVSLQIEGIWADCSNDSDIRKALEDLPRNLTETYDRCLRRILSKEGIFASGYALKALRWVLESVRPLSLTQLRQALAIDPMRGTLDYDKIPSAQDTMRSCANLIVLDAEDHVLLAHHSLCQYLNEHAYRVELLAGTLLLLSPPLGVPVSDLAMLCVTHLTSASYSLAIEPTFKSPVLQLEPAVISQLTGSVPRYIKSFLPQLKPVRIKLPPIKVTRVNMAELPDFFHFAREQWPELTRVLTTGSTDWSVDTSRLEKFLDLVLQPNLTWRLHPWEPLGQSIDSHYFGLIGWAIVNRHKPMLKALFTSDFTKVRGNLYITPFHQYGSLNAIFLAARSNEPWIFEAIRRQVENHGLEKHLWSQDSQRWSALHHAIDSRSTRLIGQLYGPYSKGLQNPLELAAAKGYDDIVKILIEFLGFDDKESRLLATKAAIQNGHCSLLVEQLSILRLGEPAWKIIEKALIEAARAGHTIVIKHVLQEMSEQHSSFARHSPWSIYSNSWRESILSAAIDAKQSSVVACTLDCASMFDLPEALLTQSIVLAVQQEDLILLDGILDKLCEVSKEVPHDPIRSLSLSKISGGALSHAVGGNHLQAARILLDRDIHAGTGIGIVNNTALRQAIMCKNRRMTSLLLEYKAVPYPSYLQLTDHLEIVELLLQNGASPTDISANGTSALHKAVTRGNLAVLELLLLYSSDRSPRDDSQRTPLMIAAALGYSEILRRLCIQPSSSALDRNNDIDLFDGAGRSALTHSYIGGHSECTEILLNHGANPAALNQEGQSVVHTISQLPPDLSLWKAMRSLEGLISEGKVDVDTQDHYGRTALHFAVEKRNSTFIWYLLRYGANANLKENKLGQTPIHMLMAVNYEASTWFRSFINDSRHPLDLDAQDGKGDTALHIALRAERYDAARDLVTAGADYHIKDCTGVSPMFLVGSVSSDGTQGFLSAIEKSGNLSRMKPI